jgi:hypothetical protein
MNSERNLNIENFNIENFNIGSSQLPEVDRRYQCLDMTKNEIRLLNLLPICYVDEREYRVGCNLFVTSFNTSLKYLALSYT